MLIIDDDTAVLRIIREALEHVLHWDVDTSPKPEYGFELALKKSYDLMIFDFSMPLIDGTLLFLLISKAYENSSPARRMPPLLRLRPRLGRTGPRPFEGITGARIPGEAFHDQSAARESESVCPGGRVGFLISAVDFG